MKQHDKICETVEISNCTATITADQITTFIMKIIKKCNYCLLFITNNAT